MLMYFNELIMRLLEVKSSTILGLVSSSQFLLSAVFLNGCVIFKDCALPPSRGRTDHSI